MTTIEYRISKCFWKESFYGMVCYAILCYGMVWKVWYAMRFQCFTMRFLCYAMLWFMLWKISIAQLYNCFIVLVFVIDTNVIKHKKNKQMKLLICDITSDQQCTFLSVTFHSCDKEYMKVVICRYKEINLFLCFSTAFHCYWSNTYYKMYK